jgi:hypothetical protein
VTYYVPGLGEKDPDKTIRSLMQAHEKAAANTTDIAAIQAAIAGPPWGTGTVTSVGSGTGLTGGPITTTGSLAVSLSSLTNSLGADVALNNTANYFDGPSIAQGTSGTWFVSGTVTINTAAATSVVHIKLWDGTSVVSSSYAVILNTVTVASISLSGVITSPAANLRISVRDTSNTTSSIRFNLTGNSKDSTITAVRIA